MIKETILLLVDLCFAAALVFAGLFGSSISVGTPNYDNSQIAIGLAWIAGIVGAFILVRSKKMAEKLFYILAVAAPVVFLSLLLAL